MCDSYQVIGLDNACILSSILEGTEIPVKMLEDYSAEECALILPHALDMIRSVILKNAGFPELDQEAMDRLLYKAGKDSSNSSMRPSSDMFGNRTTTPKDSPEEIENSQAADRHNSSSSQSSAEVSTIDEEASGKHEPSGNASADAASEAASEAALRKDHHRSRRTSSGKKPGKQNGAKGYGFKAPDHIDRVETITVIPEECKGCPHKDECLANAALGQGHNVYDVEYHIVKKVYKPATMTCPAKEEEEAPRYTADYPQGASGPNQYGKTIKTHVVLNFIIGMVAYLRNAEITFPTFGLGSLSPATILRYVHELAVLVQPAVDRILQVEHDLKCVHCDETGGNVNGKMYWIHCIATRLYTFISAQEKRGKEGMDAIGFLENYVGTVVHDCWSSYWKYTECQHSICNEHIERELQGLYKFFKNADRWAGRMTTLLQDMLQAKHEAMNQKLTALPPDQYKSFSDRFDALIFEAEAIHQVPPREQGKRGRQKKGRARALVDRMKQHKSEIFRFLDDFDIPYSNNIAEQSFRMFSVRRSVGIFRTYEGMKDFCTIWSYVSTARKHEISYHEAITRAFDGESVSVLFPDDTSSSHAA